MTTKWRGAHVAPNITSANMTALGQTDANIIRYPFNPNYWDESLAILDQLLNEALLDNKKVIINVHQPLAGQNPAVNMADRVIFCQQWSMLAYRYKDSPTVFAYGILNEPSGSGQQVNALMRAVYDAIRAIDPEKRIIVTCPHSDPAQFYKTKFIPGDPNVWYEVHQYLPMKLTHQGISGNLYPKKYPGNGWSKEYLKDKLKHVRGFQREHHARIYVGEFGISTFAPEQSRANWFRDCIDIFEDYGWNWTYHAWREAPVWDVENYSNVYDVVKKGWAKNI